MLKKITLFAALLFSLCYYSVANTVSVSTAKNVATSIYNSVSQSGVSAISLLYTESNEQGEALYYVFDVNNHSGFVIISAEDAVHPLLAYSTEGGFEKPTAQTSVAGFLNGMKQQISWAKANGAVAKPSVEEAWANAAKLSPANAAAKLKGSVSALGTVTYSSVAPLLQTTWNQSPYYNDSCPSKALTGCVATAMAQIMKYWNYPTKGTGSSSYCDCKNGGYSENYGTLSANYGATTYNWNLMPKALAGNSAVADSIGAVAQLMYQAGVSVEMDYSPTESGANVITADDTICAQRSFVKYFGYDPLTIRGLKRGTYADSTWISIIMDDLTKGRVVQYVGDSGTQGHTWLLDGYNSVTNTFHMNWGWGGYANGYYNLNNLNAEPGYVVFNSGHEILVGIQPIRNAAPVSDFIASASYLCGGGSITYTDQSSNKANAWSWTFPGGTPSTSTAQNPTVTYSTAGRYNATLVAKNNYGTGTTELKTNFVSIVGLTTAAVSCKPASVSLYPGSGIGITYVELNTLSNASGDAVSDGGYVDFSCVKTTLLETGTAYTMKVVVGYYNKENLNVYIDYNNNGVFTDAGEEIYTGTNLEDTVTIHFTTPGSPVQGIQLRMRVEDEYYAVSIASSCANLSYGQAEDYAVSFNSNTGIANAEAAENDLKLFPNPASQSATLSFNLTESGLVTVSLMDITGKVVATPAHENMSAGGHSLLLDLSALNTGFYMARLHSPAGERIVKLEVVR